MYTLHIYCADILQVLHGRLHGRCTDWIKYARTSHGFTRTCTDARTPHGRCTDISWCPILSIEELAVEIDKTDLLLLNRPVSGGMGTARPRADRYG